MIQNYISLYTNKDKGNNRMKRYTPLLKEETKYIDFSKTRDNIFLTGFIKNKEYNIMCFWAGDFTVRCTEIEKGLHNLVYNKDNSKGGSPAQLLSALFLTVFKIPVPKLDNEGGSGLDVNHLLDTLIKKYKFKVEK